MVLLAGYVEEEVLVQDKAREEGFNNFRNNFAFFFLGTACGGSGGCNKNEIPNSPGPIIMGKLAFIKVTPSLLLLILGVAPVRPKP